MPVTLTAPCIPLKQFSGCPYKHHRGPLLGWVVIQALENARVDVWQYLPLACP